MATIEQVGSLKAHSDKVWSVAVHPQQALVATASSDRTCKVFSLGSRQAVAELDGAHKRSARSVAWKPTGGEPSLACGSFDSTISVWGQDGDEWALLAVIEGHENEVKGVSWSHDGSYLASCSRDKSIWIWEADEDNEEFECVSVLQEHSQDVKHVVWHPREDLLASSSYDDTVRLWKEDYDDWVCVATLTGHDGTVWGSDFDKQPGPARLCSASDDGTVRVWARVAHDDADAEFRDDDADQVWVLQCTLPKAHSRAVYSVSWSAVSGRIASTGADGLLVVYQELAAGEWRIVAQHELAHGCHEVNCVAWAPATDTSGETLVTAGDDGKVNIWSLSAQP